MILNVQKIPSSVMPCLKQAAASETFNTRSSFCHSPRNNIKEVARSRLSAASHSGKMSSKFKAQTVRHLQTKPLIVSFYFVVFYFFEKNACFQKARAFNSAVDHRVLRFRSISPWGLQISRFVVFLFISPHACAALIRAYLYFCGQFNECKLDNNMSLLQT